MPDISMCSAACPKSRQCYRHKDSGTVPDKWRQSYTVRETGPCDDFWQVSARVKAENDWTMP